MPSRGIFINLSLGGAALLGLEVPRCGGKSLNGSVSGRENHQADPNTLPVITSGVPLLP